MSQEHIVRVGQTIGRPGLLRGLNSLNALSLVQQEGATISARVAASIGVSRTATEAILSDLLESGWLARVAPEEGPPLLGRPAARYDLNPHVGYLAAIEFDSSRVGVAISDFRGRILASVQNPVPDDLDAASRLAAAVALFEATAVASHIEYSEIRCVAVASPGSLQDGKVLHFGGHGMPGWIGVDLGEQLRAALNLPVVAEGDSALAALAERRLGAGRQTASFVYIYASQRTGAAIVSDGRLLRGAHGAVGLVGELPELRWRELETAFYSDTPVEDSAAIIGLGISAMVLAVDPELVLIGGPNLARIEQVIDAIREEVARRCPIPPRVAMAQFGADAVMQGAICLAVDTVNAALSSAVSQGGALPQPNQVGALLRDAGSLTRVTAAK